MADSKLITIGLVFVLGAVITPPLAMVQTLMQPRTYQAISRLHITGSLDQEKVAASLKAAGGRVQSVRNSSFLEVRGYGPSPKEAVRISNQAAANLVGDLQDFEDVSARIVEEAMAPRQPHSPNFLRRFGISAGLALVLGLIGATIIMLGRMAGSRQPTAGQSGA